jgi:hypothetical protein
MSPISPVFPGSPSAKVHFALRIEESAGLTNGSIEEGRLSLSKGLKIVEEMPSHAVDRQFLKRSRHVKLDEQSILEALRVRVGVDY